MSAPLHEALKAQLAGRITARDGRPVVAPQNERELASLLLLLRQHRGRLHHDVELSREHFAALGAVDVRSGVVEVGAGMNLTRLEQELRSRDLSLGPLSPGMLLLNVGELLEGPYAGLRAIPGGRLESLALALVALMPDGLRFVSRPSPRSAAGPDLDALFLGGEARFGIITQATLRCFPRPRAERAASYSFSELPSLLDALRAGLAEGCGFRRAHLARRGDRFHLVAALSGTTEAVERDLSSLGHQIFARGGRSSGHDAQSPSPASLPERELSWAEVHEQVARGVTLVLHRISLESTIAEGVEQGGVPMLCGAWANRDVLQAAIAQADPAGILGGAP